MKVCLSMLEKIRSKAPVDGPALGVQQFMDSKKEKG